ncbi:protein FAM189B isoform X2 [Denticeps clupeoides]|uniref:protein FAM189B isoform X2 n=1 Tax=Denticeps clupeoides TaxID=299321 RepID=UPI0010A59CD3|nr:protein FAM189B isoform X2 [Denticeps clupeoides]
MPSPSDSSSVLSMSGSRALSGGRRVVSGRGSTRLLLYLGLCHLGLGAMVLAFSFTSLAFTSSPKVRHPSPFWAGFFVVASGVVGVISWRRPLTLVVSLFMLLSAVCVILSLAGSMPSCQTAQMVKSHFCQSRNGVCECCDPSKTCPPLDEEQLVLYRHTECDTVRHQLKDLLFSACGLSILSTIICTLSTVTCSLHIFSLDLLHLLAPHHSRSVNPECTTPQDAFLTNMLDFEEFVPPIPPPPYYPPEYTCSSETDAQSITYNGSMESPVPLYPTDCPPPYEAVMGHRAASEATVFDTHNTDLSGERGTSTAFSGEEIVDIPDDSSPSEDSCLLEVGVGVARRRGTSESGEGGEYISFRSPTLYPTEGPTTSQPQSCFRGERSNSCSSPSTYNTSTYRSPVLCRQALLASSCSQLEQLGGAVRSQPHLATREIHTQTVPFHQVPPVAVAEIAAPVLHAGAAAVPTARLLHRKGCSQVGGSFPLMRSHSEPGLRSADASELADSAGSKGGSEESHTGAGPTSETCVIPCSSLPLPVSLLRKGSAKASPGHVPFKPPPGTPLHMPKDCARSLTDLKVTRVLVARFLHRSRRSLVPSEHSGGCSQGTKRRGGDSSLPLEQVLRYPWGASRGQQHQQHVHHHRCSHHHSHSDSRHDTHWHDNVVHAEGIHLRSCGDLNSSSAASLHRLHPQTKRSSGALYSESAL